MKEFVIDLFCGAGGTSTGIHMANCDSTVIACVNHDAKAIESHRLNHPQAQHFIEDIRNPEVLFFLKIRVKALRKLYPGCIITIWASAECTNLSKAKGGMSRDADSRTLADHLDQYIEALDPDYVMLENVVEFMQNGPLRIKKDKKKSNRKFSVLRLNPKSKNKKIKYHMEPVPEKKGIYYIRWKEHMTSYGYRYDHRILNAANFGAYTSRTRYFSQLAKGDLPIYWPEQTHAKNPEKEKTLFDDQLLPWKSVKDVLNLEKEGISIFNRKIPLVDNTLERVYAGLVKFTPKGEDVFIKKYYSGRPAGKVISVNGPAGTVTTAGGQGLVKAQFMQSYYGNGGTHSMNEPCPTVPTKDRFGKVDVQFLTNSYNGGGQVSSIENPGPTVTSVPKSNLTSCVFIDQQYGQSKPAGIDQPLGTLTQNPKYSLVSADPWIMDTSFKNKGRSIEEPAPTILASRKHHYIINPQYKNTGNSIEKPCPTIIARQDKAPLGLISCVQGGYAIPVYDTDSPIMIKIKEFMAAHGIVDIKMRMLDVVELLQIQGFPKDYRMVGNQTDKKKFIGNSVEVTVAKKIFEAHGQGIQEHFKTKIAA